MPGDRSTPLQTSTEELFFRGYLFTNLREVYPARQTILITALAFAVLADVGPRSAELVARAARAAAASPPASSSSTCWSRTASPASPA